MSWSPLSFAVHDPFGNGAGLANALAQAGHRRVDVGERADVLLIETDMPMFEFREIIDRHRARGAKVLLYPHGAGLSLWYDNLFEPYEAVDANLLFSVGHVEVLRRIGYPRPAHAIGWWYTELAPFRACRDIRHVVFAPTHPSGGDNNTMAAHHRERNASSFAALLEGPWRLTVRLMGTPEQNGLWAADRVNWVAGRREKLPIEIDAADVVVAGRGSFPSQAIARGVPTVMHGQFDPPQYGLPDEPLLPLRRPELYRDYIRYPFDADDGPLDEVMHAAARDESAVAQWKRRFIGPPLDGPAFAALVERIARGRPESRSVAIDEGGRFSVLGLADEMLERPALLAAYTQRFGPEDDATLILWGPGLDEATLLEMVQAAVAEAGIDEERLPDVLLLPLPSSPEADRELAARADALLSEWPPAGRIGDLPRFGADDAGALRDAAVRSWSETVNR